MSDLIDEMMKDSDSLPSDDKLLEVRDECQRLLALTSRVAEIEELLKSTKANLFKQQTEVLPNLFAKVGMSMFILDSGFKVSIDPYCSSKMIEEKKEECFAWMEEKGLADVIKHKIEVDLTKGEDETAAIITTFLKEKGISYLDGKSIHWATLNKVVRELFQKGINTPSELFDTFIGNKAKITKA